MQNSAVANKSNTPEIKTVIFDLGGVLIDWNPRYLFRDLFKDEEKMEYFLTHVCSHDWNVQQDAGRTFKEAIEEVLGKYPDHADMIRAYDERWEETLKGAIEENVELMKAIISKGYNTYALTNWSAEKFIRARELFPFLAEFKGIVVSGEEKLIKPDPRLFEVLFQRYDLDPKTCLFIDDSLPNCKTGQSLGMQTIHLSHAPDLKKHLDERGVLDI